MRFQSFNVLLVAALAFLVDATNVAERFASYFFSGEEVDYDADVKGADNELRNLKAKKAARAQTIDHSYRRSHVRAALPAVMRMRSDPNPPPACESVQLVSGPGDCVISNLFWQDYDVKFTNIQYNGTQDLVRFDVAPYAQQMCEDFDDVEVFWLSAFPSDMTAGTQCGLWEDVDCGDEGHRKVGTQVVGCAGSQSIYVDVFSREGLKLQNNVPNGVLAPAACANLAAANPNMYHRNYVCHKRFEVSCVPCPTPS